MTYKRIKERPTIGFFVDWVENPYHLSLVSGVRERAQEKGANLIIFVGGCINSPRKWESPRNIIYDFVRDNTLDGLVISSGSIGHFSTTGQMIDFFGKYNTLPVISISQLIHGVTSILTDTISGLKKLLLHLIKDHRYKKIAMITGPEGNQEADARCRVYRETLAECGCLLDPNLVTHGDFILESGIAAMKQLLLKKVKIDAVFAANDDMAIGAMNVIKEQGLRIPEDIALAGFDDIDLGRFSNPSLSTVRQPIYEQGARAVDAVLSLIRGGEEPPEILLQTEPVIRESCGCLNASLQPIYFESEDASPVIDIGTPSFSDYDEKEYAAILKSVEDNTGSRGKIFDLSDIKNLFTAFYESLKNRDPKYFLNLLSIIMEKSVMEFKDEPFFQNIITAMRTRYISAASVAAKTSADKLKTAEDIFHAARISISNFIQRSFGFLKTITDAETKDFRDISEELVSIADMEDILSLLRCKLDILGIKSCYISLYEKKNPDHFSYSSYLKMVFTYEKGRNLPEYFKGITYPATDIFPGGLLSEKKVHSFYLEPIFFGSYQLGFALFEFGDNKGLVYNMMRRVFINSALKAAIYIKQVQIHSVSLEVQVAARTEALSKANKLLSKLYQDQVAAEESVRRLNEQLEQRVIERTAELEETNKKLNHTLETLKSTQNKLVESEKMAALGGVVAGVAHEINTPLGIGVTAASHLDSITRNLNELFLSNNLEQPQIEKYIRTARYAAAMVLTNLRKVHKLVNSFKEIAVDQSSEEKSVFNLKDYIKDILLSFEPQLRRTNIAAEIRCPDNLVMNSFPRLFSQVVTNLIENSLIHAFEPDQDGNIIFNISSSEDTIRFIYSDDGKGIAIEHQKKIFEPFFTTTRNKGGTGLGLHLVYIIVTQTFDGTLECRSVPGKGTTFEMLLPLGK